MLFSMSTPVPVKFVAAPAEENATRQHRTKAGGIGPGAASLA